MKENQNPIAELQELSPFLAQLKKEQTKPIFKTPLFYFDTLEDKVFEKIADRPTFVVTKTPNRFQIWAERWQQWLWQPQTACALSAGVLLTTATLFWFQKQPTVVPTIAMQEEVHHYIKNNLDDFDDDLLAAYHDALLDHQDLKLNFTTEELEYYLNEVPD